MVPKLHRPRWRLHWIREEPQWSDRSTCSQSGNISERNKKTSMCSHHSNMFNKKQWDFDAVRVFWTQVKKFILQPCKKREILFLEQTTKEGNVNDSFFIWFCWMLRKLHHPTWRLHWIWHQHDCSHRNESFKQNDSLVPNQRKQCFYFPIPNMNM